VVDGLPILERTGAQPRSRDGVAGWFVVGRCGCKIVRALKMWGVGETNHVANDGGCFGVVGGWSLLGG